MVGNKFYLGESCPDSTDSWHEPTPRFLSPVRAEGMFLCLSHPQPCTFRDPIAVFQHMAYNKSHWIRHSGAQHHKLFGSSAICVRRLGQSLSEYKTALSIDRRSAQSVIPKLSLLLLQVIEP
jgi:hypothetical protein